MLDRSRDKRPKYSKPVTVTEQADSPDRDKNEAAATPEVEGGLEGLSVANALVYQEIKDKTVGPILPDQQTQESPPSGQEVPKPRKGLEYSKLAKHAQVGEAGLEDKHLIEQQRLGNKAPLEAGDIAKGRSTARDN